MEILIIQASAAYTHFAEGICKLYQVSAEERGVGIAIRSVDYVQNKMCTGDAAIALDGGTFVGFCYIETFDKSSYVSNSGLIVHPNYRKMGVARKIKHFIFHMAQERYPNARVFGITTSLAVMRINSALGYTPVTFNELTRDDAFWSGCSSCAHYKTLQNNDNKMCLCTAMLAPSKRETPENGAQHLNQLKELNTGL